MCDKCNNINPCACNESTFCGCNEPNICGCSTKLDLLCTYYTGETLEPIGITEGMDGTQVVSKINEYVKNILQNLDISPTVIESIGNGVAVYKGLSAGIIDEFKSLIGTTGIDITPEEDMVRFTINQEWLESTIIQVIEDNGGNIGLELKWSSLETPGNPNSNPESWHTPSTTNDIWMAIRSSDVLGEGTWDIIKTKGEQGIQGPPGPPGPPGQSTQGTPGQSTINANVFKRSETQPETPIGGTYIAPTPSGWSDGIPPANGNAAWMSTRIFTSDGQAPQQPTWSEPSLVADTASIDYEFSSFTGTSPGTPTQPLNGATWHNVGTEDDIWMAFRAVNNGAYGVWSVVRIKGEDGAAGTGYTVVSHNPMESLAVGSDGVASIEKDFLVQIDVFMNSTQLTATSNAILQANQYKINLPLSPLPGITITKSSHNTLQFKVAAGTVFPKDSVLTEIEVVAGLGQTSLKSSFAIAPVWTAEDAQVLTLTSDANVIKQTSTGYIPSTVTLRAVKNNYNEVVSWDSEPISVLVTTGDTVIISSEDLFPDEEDSVKINISTPNGLSDSTTIVRVRDGQPGQPGTAGSGYSIVSSNPMQAIAVGSDSTTSSQQSYLVSFVVYKNSTPLQGTTGTTLTDSQFRIEVPTSPKPGVTVLRENDQTLRYTVANGVVFTDESVTSLIDITVGSANTVMKSSFVIVPIKTAEDAVSLNLNVDSNTVKFDAFNNLVTPNIITAMAVQQNSTETITWSSVPVGIVSGTGTLKNISTSGMFTSGVNSVKIRIDAGGMYDETTIVRIQDGAPGQNGENGAPGINGTSGPTPRLLELVNGGQYENGQDFIDYAYYRSNDANEGWYTVKVVGGVRTVVTYTGGVPDTSPTGSWVKAPFTKEMSFGTVVAEQANLAGFIFRNQTLNSQAGALTASCHPTPGVQLPNLSLDGLQGIIRFLDRMILDKNGVTLKDDCGRPRMVFRWENGTPALKFLGETGLVTWEAGQSGYIYITTGTRPSTWDSFRMVRVSALNSYDETSNNMTEFNNDVNSEVLISSLASAVENEMYPGVYEHLQFSCSGPTTTGTPYSLVFTINAFSNPTGVTAYSVHKFNKGDMAADLNKYVGVYMTQQAIDESQVGTAPAGTFPPDGWYIVEGDPYRERDNNTLCSATHGVYPLLEQSTGPYNYSETIGYSFIPISYLKNGKFIKTVTVHHEETWQADTSGGIG